MQHLEVSCAVRRFFKSLGFKGLMKVQVQVSRQIFKNSSNIKFNGSPSRGRRVVPRGRTNRQLTVAIRTCANTPNDTDEGYVPSS